MKKYALFTINLDTTSDFDPNSRPLLSELNAVLRTYEKNEAQSAQTRKLSSFALLIDTKRDSPLLHELISLCSESKYRELIFSYEVLHFETDNEWIKTKVKTK